MRLADIKAESTRLNPDSGIKHIKTYSLCDNSQEISEFLISRSQAAFLTQQQQIVWWCHTNRGGVLSISMQ